MQNADTKSRASWWFSLLGASAVLVGCGGGTSSPRLGTVTLSSSTELIAVHRNLSVPDAVSLGGATPPSAGSVPAPGGATPALGGTHPTDTPGPSAATGATPTASASPTVDLASAFDIDISVVLSGFVSVNPLCQLFAPYYSVECSSSGFTLSSSELVGNSGLRMNVTEEGAFGASNTLPVRVLSLRQVSNTGGSPFTDDQVRGGTEFSGGWYFLAHNVNGKRKWFRMDASGSTVQISNTRGDQDEHDFTEPDFLNPVVAGSYLYFVADNSHGAAKLYRTDGTSVAQVSDTVNDPSTTDGIGQMAALNGMLFFVANNSNGVSKLYRTDGSTVVQVSNTTGNPSSADIPGGTPIPLVAVGDYLYYVGKNQNGVAKLFRTDGTTVEPVSNTMGNTAISDEPNSLTAFDGALFFTALKAPGVNKIYRAGTTVNQITNTVGNQTVDDFPGLLVPCGESLYFRSRNTNSTTKLFKFDGTAVTQVSNTRGDETLPDAPTPLTCAGTSLVFYSRNPQGRGKLFATDGTTVSAVSDSINDASQNDEVADIHVYGDGTYFVSYDGDGKQKFHAFLEGRVYRIADFNPGNHDSDFLIPVGSGRGEFLGVFANRLLFNAVTDGGTANVSKMFALCDPNEGC